MPTARPSITPSTGVTDTNSTIPENDSDASEATPDAQQGGDERQGRAEHGPEHDEQDDRGDDHAGDLARARGSRAPSARSPATGGCRRPSMPASATRSSISVLVSTVTSLIGSSKTTLATAADSVLRHGAVAGRQLRQGLAHLELGRLLVDLRALPVQLGLAVVELLLRRLQLRAYGGERAGLARLCRAARPAPADRRRSAPGAALSWASPCSSCSAGRRPPAAGRVVDLLLGGERVGHVGDPVDLGHRSNRSTSSSSCSEVNAEPSEVSATIAPLPPPVPSKSSSSCWETRVVGVSGSEIDDDRAPAKDR